MNDIATKMQRKENFCALNGASDKNIQNAEITLGLQFAQDYREYVAAFGAASFAGHELTGVCGSKRLNVVPVTLEERSNTTVPLDAGAGQYRRYCSMAGQKWGRLSNSASYKASKTLRVIGGIYRIVTQKRIVFMGRISTKENKTVYQISREALGYSREKASEMLGWISPERIEKIENEKSTPRSDEVLEMSIGYKNPNLCNHYCAKECPIGQQYVPEVKIKDLSQIVLEMLASLNAMHKKQERLIEITADGQITGDEIQDFIHIQEELEKISITVETLQLWSEQMLANGSIDIEAYNAAKSK